MAKSRLHAVYELGQSVWYDNIQRGLIRSGDLQRLIDNDAVVGMTSNPTIFDKAISGSPDYDEQIRQLVTSGVTDPTQIFWTLAIDDIRAAADVLRPIYDATEGGDGFVSLEVSPLLANDTQGTIAEARRLFSTVNRPNLMVKIPATAEGMPAIEQMTYEGVNINVTLIFALEAYRQVTEAYIRGLERRQAEGKPVKGIASVASFFVSRVDTLADKQLDALASQTDDDARKAQIAALKGKAAIANAKLAYELYDQIFHGDRFAALRQAGAATQRCLWASTSTKNPAYRDVLYVEELIGPETVDTMPPATIVAFQDHGEVSRTVDSNVAAAHETMRQLAEVGIDMNAVTKQLELDGVKAFADSFDDLLKGTAAKTEKLKQESQASGNAGAAQNQGAGEQTSSGGGGAAALSGAPTSARGESSSTGEQSASLGVFATPVDAALDRADAERYAARVWAKDPAFWKPNPADQNEITNRLGWLTVSDVMRPAIPRLYALRDDLRNAGVTHVVLFGMGGSSLAPEVLRETFGVAPGLPKLLVLDSTDPATILSVEQTIDLPHTVFIVASKSGGTIETLSQYKHFYEKVSALGVANPGAQFIAITDPGTKLDTLATERGFRDIFRNPDDIGGRYSALSFFGLVPAAIIGVDVERLLQRADAMRAVCQPETAARQNPGVWLGAIMGTLAKDGHDKVTIVVSPPIATFGYWVEQLIAESTGKEGRGILPVEGEPLGAPNVYGADRLFVYLRTNEGFDPAQDAAISALESAGQPVVRLTLGDTYDLGGEFFRWEFATAVAGALIGINAFDQPNVQESKDNTDRILQQYAATHELAQPPAIIQTERNGVAIVAEGEEAERLAGSVSLQAALETYARHATAGDYIAILAYIERTPKTNATLQAIRVRLRDGRHVATTLGYGPRFQHSTGQLHKGGANNGVFIQIVADDQVDVSIPDAPYTFSVLKQAQALGDLQSLRAHGRRVIRINLGADIAAGLAEVRQALDVAQLG